MAKAKTNDWAAKVLALLKGGNTSAAIAQIKVAPTVKDLRQLGDAVAAGGQIYWNVRPWRSSIL